MHHGFNIFFVETFYVPDNLLKIAFVLNEDIPDRGSLYTICGRYVENGDDAFKQAVNNKWFCQNAAQPVVDGKVVVSFYIIKDHIFYWKWNALCLSGGYRYDQPTYQQTAVTTCPDKSQTFVVNNTKWTVPQRHIVTGDCKVFQNPNKSSSIYPRRSLKAVTPLKPCISTTTASSSTTTSMKMSAATTKLSSTLSSTSTLSTTEPTTTAANKQKSTRISPSNLSATFPPTAIQTSPKSYNESITSHSDLSSTSSEVTTSPISTTTVDTNTEEALTKGTEMVSTSFSGLPFEVSTQNKNITKNLLQSTFFTAIFPQASFSASSSKVNVAVSSENSNLLNVSGMLFFYSPHKRRIRLPQQPFSRKTSY